MLGLTTPSGQGRASSLRAVELVDFTGGLNLSAGQFKLGINETGDSLNVDVHARGGIEQRGGMTAFTDQVGIAGTEFLGGWRHIGDDGSEFLSVGYEDGVGRIRSVDSAGVQGAADPTLPVVNPSADRRMVGVQMNGRTYVTSLRYQAVAQYAQGADVAYDDMLAVSDLSFEDDPLVMSDGVFPNALAAAVFDNRMFVASTFENGESFTSRVRWSRDGNPESWASEDWVDVDLGEDGDQITALAVHGEVLVIFKSRAMYVLFRDESTGYQLRPVDRSVGATNPYAVASGAGALWFWDGRLGLHMWRGVGEGPQFVGAKILQGLEEARIPINDPVSMGFVNSRLWIATTLDGALVNLVFNPQVGGAWSVYSPAVELPQELTGRQVGYAVDVGRWMVVDQRTAVDDFGAGGVGIDSYWTSPWIFGREHYRRKKFRRPKFTMSADGAASIKVELSKDYSSAVHRTFRLDLEDLTDGDRWGDFNWGQGVWSSGETNRDSELTQGPGLCTARAVQFKVTGPSEAVRWRLDSLVATYITQPLRS